MRLRPVSLRARVALAFAAGMALVLTAVAAFVALQLRGDLRQAVDMGLRSRAQALVAETSRDGPSLPAGPLRLIDSDEAFAQVLTPGGAIVRSSRAVAAAPLLDGAVLRRLRRPLFAERTPRGLERSRLLAVPVDARGRRLVVVAGATLGDSEEAVRRVLVLFAVALAVCSLIGWALAGAALRPVRRMSERAAAITPADATQRLPVPSSDPALAQLAITLNATFDRLREALRRERRFVDDASHELRTPLATLKAEVDSALARERSRDELEEALRAAAEEIRHLTRIAEGLLVLARADGGRIPVRREPAELRELLDGAARSFGARAEAAAAELEIDAPAVLVDVDPTRLRQALDNLLDNALRHVPPGAAVRVEARLCEGLLQLSVQDGGPGFSERALEQAFRPFNRAAGEEGGTGLGLAIVRAVAEAHGGRARAENDQGGGARVTLELPVALVWPMPAVPVAT
jgi:two-component system, OmpR family, sensor kinase